MDQLEYTKIAAAILLPLLLIFGFKTIVETRTAHVASKPGYSLPGGEAAPAAAEAPKAEAGKAAEAKPADAKTAEAKPAAEAPTADAPKADAAKTEAPAAAGGAEAVLALLPKADADAGKANFAKCKACHNIEKGKPKAVGPNLWGVVNRPKASFEGFEYSPAMKAKGGNWTFADLAGFISNPKGYVTGTKMVFNGLPDPKDAADVIAYLAKQSDTPAELPK